MWSSGVRPKRGKSLSLSLSEQTILIISTKADIFFPHIYRVQHILSVPNVTKKKLCYKVGYLIKTKRVVLIVIPLVFVCITLIYVIGGI